MSFQTHDASTLWMRVTPATAISGTKLHEAGRSYTISRIQDSAPGNMICCLQTIGGSTLCCSTCLLPRKRPRVSPPFLWSVEKQPHTNPNVSKRFVQKAMNRTSCAGSNPLTKPRVLEVHNPGNRKKLRDYIIKSCLTVKAAQKKNNEQFDA